MENGSFWACFDEECGRLLYRGGIVKQVLKVEKIAQTKNVYCIKDMWFKFFHDNGHGQKGSYLSYSNQRQ